MQMDGNAVKKQQPHQFICVDSGVDGEAEILALCFSSSHNAPSY